MLFSLKNSKASSSSLQRSPLTLDWLKRFVEVSLAAVSLLVFSPILIVCGVAILLGGASSVLFTQVRIGRKGRPFMILKLTTMKVDAHLNGPLVSSGADKRVTRMGKFIRAYGFNELPQFLNVIRGEMSIVGPRPEVAKYVEKWEPEVKDIVLSVRPGITGLATVNFWDEGSFLEGKSDLESAYLEEVLPEKLRIEIWYVRNRTFFLDLRIMATTLLKAFGGKRLLKANKMGKTIPIPEERI